MATPITVTATLSDLGGTAVQGAAFVRFKLREIFRVPFLRYPALL
jgi:hypothetical protein